MKYSLFVNQKNAIELGIKNVNQAIVFDFLTTVSTWAKPQTIDNDVYYWVARSVVVDQLPLLSLKTDTIYRYFKQFEALGLIEYVKLGQKDCLKMTAKSRGYLSDEGCDYGNPSANFNGNSSSDLNPNDGKNSDLNPNNAKNSDLNPNKLGFESESNSDLNPTYKTINKHNTININTPSPANNSNQPIGRVDEEKNKMMADYIFAKLVDLNPKMKTPNLNAWAGVINKMQQYDNRSMADIQQTFDWANGDNFWQTVIDTPSALRRSFDKLTLKMQQQPTHSLVTNSWDRQRQVEQEMLDDGADFMAAADESNPFRRLERGQL